MDNLNAGIKGKILEFLKTKKIGASSSEIAKAIGHNRITITKYLEVMRAHKILVYEDVAQAKIWRTFDASEKPKILVVDDEPHIANLIKLSLTPGKFDVFVAYTGKEALNIVSRQNPDLIILDLMLPGMNGFEVCNALRENALTQHIPILILSAKGELEDKVKGLKMGADDYLSKPFEPVELEARVDSLIIKSGKRIDTHPLTKLPGAIALMERMENIPEDAMAINFHFENAEKYRKKVGFKKWEEFIIVFSRLLKEQIGQHDFLAHTVDDNFVVITGNPSIQQKVAGDFKKLAPFFFRNYSDVQLVGEAGNTIALLKVEK